MENVDKNSVVDLFTPPPGLPRPAVSVVIPLYNAEEFIGECLESILNQTFQSFEVIVVDDCSTDNSAAIVENYIPKFDGRLRLTKTETNSGGGGEPRNIGLTLANGEYVLFLDADDFILLTAFETLYNAAKKHDADVVYVGAYYRLTSPTDLILYRDGESKKLISKGLEDKPNLRIEDQVGNLNRLLLGGDDENFRAPWSKFIRREFLTENKIFFPKIPIGEDFIWVINVYCHAKRFLRLSMPFYFYVKYNDNSVTKIKREPAEQVSYWISKFIDFAENLRILEKENKILSENPDYYPAALKHHFSYCLMRTKDTRKDLNNQEIYEILHREFSNRIDLSDFVMSFLFEIIDKHRKVDDERLQTIKKLETEVANAKLIARLDIKMIPKTDKGDFQILSVSDDKAIVLKPGWLQKGGVGYQIQSYVGKLEIIAKSTVDGRIEINFRGVDIHDPDNRSKRIPCWIDYTSFSVNGRTVLDKLTSAWHDKPYRHNLNVKADDEITFEVEWLPHRSDLNTVEEIVNHRPLQKKTDEENDLKFEWIFHGNDDNIVEGLSVHTSPPKISVIIPLYNAEEFIGECLESVLNQTFQNFEVIVVDDCSTDSSRQIVESYIPKFDGRLRLAKTETNSGGGSEPRNIGLNIAVGEYIIFVDADDFILLTALEKLYNAAEEHNADVVYVGVYYRLTSPMNLTLHRDSESENLIKNGLEDKPDLRIDDPNKNLRRLLLEGKEGNFSGPWTKLLRRDFLLKNKILFPAQIALGEDFIWVINVYCHAKRFLRIATPFYFYRQYNTGSVTKKKRAPSQHLSYWMTGFFDFVKSLSALEKENKILSENPAYCLAAFKRHFGWFFWYVSDARQKLNSQEIYEILHREFSNRNEPANFTIPFLFSIIDADRKVNDERLQTIKKLETEVANAKLIARLDIKMIPKTDKGDFQILFVSDDKAIVLKPGWLQKGGVGYQIQSYVGKLEIVVKATVDGRIEMNFRGVDIHDPDNRSKRIPCWIDYTSFSVNGRTILDKLTPAWHDKPYRHNLNVKADEKITFEVEWLPHRSDTNTVEEIVNHQPLQKKTNEEMDLKFEWISHRNENNNVENLSVHKSPPKISVIIPMYNAEENISKCLESVLNQTFQNFEVIVVDDCSTDSSRQIVESYIPKFDGRLVFAKTELNSGGGSKPRNIGLTLAGGKYVIFVDANDFILLTALEKLYNAAEEHNADVVYTSSYFRLNSSTDVLLYRDGESKKLINQGLEDKSYLRIDDQKENLNQLLLEEPEGNFRNLWSKFIRREFLINNKIFFPQISLGEDFIWVINVYCHVKRFLRLPMPIYFLQDYNIASVAKMKQESSQQVIWWISTFVDFMENLRALEKKNKILSENSAYGLAALRSYFAWCLDCIEDTCKDLSNQKIYEILYHELAKKSFDLVVPFLFSIIDADRKISDSRLQKINNLEKQIANFKNVTVLKEFPAVSVIIPLYNAEKYIGECLDSLLAQTFQNFEVIVVDDCSTDSSVEIVNSYAPKFNGQLILAKTKQNSGGGALPRNKGIMISRGEYIQFLDADDKLTKTALEELYMLAKCYDSDIVYCEKFHEIDDDGSNLHLNNHQGSTLVKVPTLESYDMFDRVEVILQRKFSPVAWDKFVRRKLLLENEILFPNMPHGEDRIWNHDLLFCAKKYLRVPNAVCIHRLSDVSIMRKDRSPQQTVNFWLNSAIFHLKDLDKSMNNNEFFNANPSFRYFVLKEFIDFKLRKCLDSGRELTEDEIFSAIKDEYGERLGEYDVLIPALCSALYDEKKTHSDYAQMLFQYFTARLDIRFIPKTGSGDFQILSMSDEKATILKPTWLQKGSVGYQIQSYFGKLKIVVQATADGQIQSSFRGVDVSDPDDRSKRIPYWIDYTALKINGQTILGTLVPAWHDKPYNHNMEVKANEEITLEFEWLPHRKEQNDDAQALFRYFTARLDIKMIPKDGEGDFQILSVSDDRAKVLKPGWFQKDGIGYQIQSYAGELEIVAKATVDGRIQMNFRGVDVPESGNKSKRIPYWIDYTAFSVNGQTILDRIIPAWYSEPYRHNMEVKADEEITLEVEWLPHRKAHNDDAQALFRYFTARLDVKMTPKNGEGDFQILSVSDNKIKILKPNWLQKGGTGYQIQSYAGKLEIVAQSTTDGQVQMDFRGVDVSDPDNKSKRIPCWIDYTSFSVNGRTIFNKLTPAWHDKPYRYKMNVRAGEKITLQIEWLPHRDNIGTIGERISRQPESKEYKLLEKRAVAAEEKLKAEVEQQKKLKAEIQKLLKKTTELERYNANYVQTIRELTARIDIQLIPKTGNGDFQILSLSDDRANVMRPKWLNKDGVGYMITSYTGKLELIAKVSTDGQIQLNLRGVYVGNPEDKTKRIPYWIDYTKLTVNGQTIVDTLTPAWHNKPYKYNIEVTADEEITLQIEWLPHRSDT